MKTIGLIGGMSWESSAEYYRLINQSTQKKLGGTHSAKSLMFSVDFGDIEKMQHEGQWQSLGLEMQKAALQLQAGGADFIVLCTNTMHRFAAKIEQAINIPFLHIADPTAELIQKTGLKTVGLLGTRFTMEQDFYKQRLSDYYGLEVLIPDEADRISIHHIIYNELVKGIIQPQSKQVYREIIARLVNQGVDCIVLGCTEIMLLVDQSDSSVPVFDTTALHAEAAVMKALD